MDKEKLRQELEQKKNELYELEKALKDAEYEEMKYYKVNTDDLLKEMKDFPRYFINRKGEVFHESGLPLPIREKENKIYVKLFDSENDLKEVAIEDLLKENF